MLDLTELSQIKPHYATNRNDLVTEFYTPCLERSNKYDRAVGYFTSSIFLLAVQPVAKFAINGGKIRLICSPQLTEKDIEAITQGYEWRDTIGQSLKKAIDLALRNPASKSSLEFLATLIAVGCLDIRIAFRLNATGIFHDKIGIFFDHYQNSISFIGSSNETLNAWDISGNHESFDVFCSWTYDHPRVQRHIDYFQSLWDNQELGLTTINFPEIARENLIAIANPDGVEAAYAAIINSHSKPQLKKSPQLHQIQAIENWNQNNHRGILQHATGSGKTFTAIIAIREWIEKGKPVLVLVPSKLLLQQWYYELKNELDDLAPTILLAGGGNSSWQERDLIEGFIMSSGEPRIILATLQTASSESFFKHIRSNKELLVVIDEVHKAGSLIFSNVFSIDSGARLGLSATPNRYGDPEGTQLILNYFEQILQPTFTLADAIASGRLSPYTYYIHEVSLSDQELEQWIKLTEKIKRLYVRSPRTASGEIILAESIKLLLIQRARILKEAKAKIPLALDIIKNNFEQGQKWLIYCDNQIQLKGVQQILNKNGFPSNEYHANMFGDPAATIDYFTNVGGILIAIKCLDEGVDIPSIDHALILASSKNPREFIQRRGRVLRKTPTKFFAEIHDAIVLPPFDYHEPEILAISIGELARASQFAENASNTAVKFQLRTLARKAGIDSNGFISNAGFEEDENDE